MCDHLKMFKCGFAETCLTNLAQGEWGTGELDYDLHFIVMIRIRNNQQQQQKQRTWWFTNLDLPVIITFSDI